MQAVNISVTKYTEPIYIQIKLRRFKTSIKIGLIKQNRLFILTKGNTLYQEY